MNAQGFESLTRAETEVLALVAEGHTNVEIARNFGVSLNTVKTHVAHILSKLAVANRREAARAYRQKRGEGRREQSAPGESDSV